MESNSVCYHKGDNKIERLRGGSPICLLRVWLQTELDETKSYNQLYNNQINARALIGQSALVYCAGKPTEKSRVFWIII